MNDILQKHVKMSWLIKQKQQENWCMGCGL